MLSGKTREKYEQLYAATAMVRDAKQETIRCIGRIGKKTGVFRYPIFVLTVLFIFIYNLFLYAFIAMHIKEKLSRALAMVMVAVMVLTSVDVLAFANFESVEAEYSIIYVAEPEAEVLYQTLQAGNGMEDIYFPDSLTVLAVKKNNTVEETATDEGGVVSNANDSVTTDVGEPDGGIALGDDNSIGDTDTAVGEKDDQSDNQTTDATGELGAVATDAADGTEDGDKAVNQDSAELSDNTDANVDDSVIVNDDGNGKNEDDTELTVTDDSTNVDTDSETDNANTIPSEKETGNTEDNNLIADNGIASENDTATEKDDTTQSYDATGNGDEADIVSAPTEVIPAAGNEPTDESTASSDSGDSSATAPEGEAEDAGADEVASNKTNVFAAAFRGFIDAFKPVKAYAEDLAEEKTDAEDDTVISADVDTVIPDEKDSDAAVSDVSPEPEYEALLVPVTWELDRNLSSRSSIKKGKSGEIFVFVPVFSNEYEVAEGVVLPVITVTIVPAPTVLSAKVGNIRVTLEALAGVFPEGVSLSVVELKDEGTLSKIDSLVEDSINSGVNENSLTQDNKVYAGSEDTVKETIAFDINVFDENGNAVQPVIPEGMTAEQAITLTFSRIIDEFEEGSSATEASLQAFCVDDGISRIEPVDSSLSATDVSIHPEHFTIYGVALTGASPAVTLANNGYPYGKNMSSSSVTLVMEIEAGSASSYQWQSSSDKSAWSDISGQTGDTITITSLSSGTWYRCKVNGVASREVQTVYPGQDGRNWTEPQESYYVSNGYMAYYCNGNSFDVTGYYSKNGQNYMLQTSYDYIWNTYSSTEAVPSASAGDVSSDASLDALKAFFSPDNAFLIVFEADLAAGQQSFSFGCDTQLGDSSTSGDYSDYAALIGTLNNDNSLKQVAMIGAASEADALDDDPAFVITPVTANPIFWLGYYGSRQKFTYNTGTRTGYSNTDIGGQNVVTAVEDVDSGMTMSWTNVPSGGSVIFSFGVGSVANTGAKKASVVASSTSLTVPDSDTGCYYAVFKKENDEKVADWTQGNGGDLVFNDLEANREYTIKVVSAEQHSNQNYTDTEDTDATTAIDPIESSPSADPEQTTAAVAFTYKSRSITVDNLNTAYTYNLVDSDNANVYSNFKTPSSTGKVVFDNLQPGTTYYLIAKSSTNNLSDKVAVKTLYEVTFNVNGHGTAPATIIDVTEGSLISKPANPVANGFGFTGWYKDSSCTDANRWNFETSTVSSNITLYAKWVPHSHNWVYEKVSEDRMVAYCTNNANGVHCENYGTDRDSAETLLKVNLSAADTAYTGLSYAGLSIVDTLTAIDSVNNTVSEPVYYVDADYQTETTAANSGAAASGKAPVNVGTYYVKLTVTGTGSQSVELKSSFSINIQSVENIDFEINPKTYVADGSDISAVYTVKNGTVSLTENVDYEISADSVTHSMGIGEYSITINGIGNYNGTVSRNWKITDATAPTAVINVSGMADSGAFVAAASVSFAHYYNSSRTVTITAADAESLPSELTVKYLLSSKTYSEAELSSFAAAKWTSLDNGGSFNVDNDGIYIVYVKVSDPSGNIAFYSSDGFTIDKVAPVVEGIANNGQYCTSVSFRVNDTGCGIDSVLIDGTDVFVNGTSEYSITGAVSGNIHEVTVADKAGNTVAITGISLNDGTVHDWDAGVITKAPTCTDDGEMSKTCNICGAVEHFAVAATGHDFDYSSTDPEAWDMVWCLKTVGGENVYAGTAYLSCSRGCGKKIPVTDAVSGQTLVDATSTDVDDVTIKYEVTVNYNDNGTIGQKNFSKLADKNVIDTENVLVDNTLSTGVVTPEDVPEIRVSGLDTEAAKNMLSQSEQTKLEDSASNYETDIFVYLEAQNLDGMISSAEKNSFESSIEEEIEGESPELKYLDLSIYKKITTTESGTTNDPNIEVSQLNNTDSAITIRIKVADLGFAQVAANTERRYIVSRAHDYSVAQDGSDVRYEIVYDGVEVNGEIPIETNLFCHFAIGYVDTVKPAVINTNPKTQSPEKEETDTTAREESQKKKKSTKKKQVASSDKTENEDAQPDKNGTGIPEGTVAFDDIKDKVISEDTIISYGEGIVVIDVPDGGNALPQGSIEAILESMLTEADKERILKGEKVTINIQVEPVKVEDEVKNAVLDVLSDYTNDEINLEDSSKLVITKTIGDTTPEILSDIEGDYTVRAELPESISESVKYFVFSYKNGEINTVAYKDNQDGTISFTVNGSSAEYVLASVKDKTETQATVDEQDKNDKVNSDGAIVPPPKQNEACVLHWFYILLMAVAAGGLLVIRKKGKRAMIIVLGSNIALGALILLLGNCSMDLPAYVVEALAVTGGGIALILHENKNQ